MNFPFKTNPKDLDPSYKIDLDFWDCFEPENFPNIVGETFCFIAKEKHSNLQRE